MSVIACMLYVLTHELGRFRNLSVMRSVNFLKVSAFQERGQQIDRITQVFAEVYFTANPGV